MDTISQAVSRINSATNILILTLGDNGDSLASGLALKMFLSKLEKNVTVYSPSRPAGKFAFLPGLGQIAQVVDLTKNLVVEVSTKKTPVAELSYRKTDDTLSIFLKPASGRELNAQDIKIGSASFPFDLIILVGIASLENLGKFYTDNTGLFFETPMINIDFRAANENYAPLNVVQMSATSCAEIVFDLIARLEGSLIDETVATQLLTGIMTETNSFQHIRTTPQTFLAASQLVGLGAKQQEIVANLYKTKSLGMLKLWGKVLATLSQDQAAGLVHARAQQPDVKTSGASPEDQDNIIKEMSVQLSFVRIHLFFLETDSNQTAVYCHSLLPLNLPQLFAQHQPRFLDPHTVKFSIPMPLNQAEAAALAKVRAEITKFKPVQ